MLIREFYEMPCILTAKDIASQYCPMHWNVLTRISCSLEKKFLI